MSANQRCTSIVACVMHKAGLKQIEIAGQLLEAMEAKVRVQYDLMRDVITVELEYPNEQSHSD